MDDVVPLAVRSSDLDTVHLNSLPQGIQGASNSRGASNSQGASKSQDVPNLPRTNWADSLSSLQLSEAQRNDPNIGIVMHWIEHKYEATTREL